MKTLFTIGILLVCALIAGFVAAIALNIAGLPGALLAGKPGMRSVRRFWVGSVIAAIGQSYVYLAYVACVVAWSSLAGARDDVVGFIVWPFAFVTAVGPVYTNLIRSTAEANQLPYGNPQAEALNITFFASIAGFLLFAFLPAVMATLWGWVPFVSN